MALNFILNGKPRAETVRPTMTVLDWLRGEARLTGTKEGCAEGDCGACTILVARPGHDGIETPDDLASASPHGSLPPCGGGAGRGVATNSEPGTTPLPSPPPQGGREHTESGATPYQNPKPRWQAVNSCLMTMGQLDGCAVLTIEGVAPAGALNAVQQAMLDADATQCGFCTPGFVMAITDLAQDGPPPADAKFDANIHEALAGNLCRCTGYRAIMEACRTLPAMPLRAPALPPRSTVHSTDGETYFAPTRLSDLLDLRARHPDAVLIAGGTDLGLRLTKGGERWPLVLATGAIAELRRVTDDGEAIRVGAAATYADALPALERRIPAFAALMRRLGSRQIRHLGTLAGNLANASPIGDTLPCLMALAAQVRLASVRGERMVAVEDFVTGYRKTVLAADEVITRIDIPVPPVEVRFAVYKLSKRFDQDISTVVAAFLAEGNRLRAAFGGMAAKVERARTFEAAWAAGRCDALSVTELETLVRRDFAPLSDHRGSAAYRCRAAAGLMRRFILEAGGDTAPLSLEAL
ncbi:FAD binding domain-containing protein [Xanthobacteraceae bacterium Astr-EGSB]|uniref:xanthine dehydrogenase small subunit n=1 Tax=Astrobacterium formosum TaxID=3069710 RepID=UPI0027AFAEF9|nr:FAD binding domain-containing protein [Xanthobacteraceae bacterium Astr-EGSB]